MHRRAILLTAMMFALAIIAIAAYAPGLHGPFLFDDFANLPSLGASGPIRDWPSFWRYITSGTADPTGRPIALLSFLLDARDWPADPFPFKRTNLALHLANGLLLAWLLIGLGTPRNAWQSANAPSDQRVRYAGVLAAAFWTLHPLFVSTTLYVVQREAMLSTLFVLLGLLAWLHGRVQFKRNATRRGLAWITLGLAGGTALATLSKANGLLLPALALTLEYALLRPMEREAGKPPLAYRQSMVPLAVLPTLAVLAYLGYEGWRGMAHGISAARPWTLGQRLLTEPRVLMDYLAQLWVPHPYSRGLFNDHLQASTSLFTPWTTLPALVLLAGLGIGGWLVRFRHPALAAAILFYLVGQSMESSTIALELYFEHRNYLPAMLMFWPLALWLCGANLHNQINVTATPPSDADMRRAKYALTAIILAGLTYMTHSAADLWGNAREQALMWASINPDSARAQANAAQAEMQAGRPDAAARRLSSALAKTPDDVQLTINLIAAECQMGHVQAEHLASAERALATARDSGTLLSSWFGRAIAQAGHPNCPQLGTPGVDALLDAALSNPGLRDQPGRLQDLYSMKGMIALANHAPDEALKRFNEALDQQVRAPAAFQQAAQLGSAGYPRQALAHLAHYESVRTREYRPDSGMAAVHQWVLDRQHYWDNELVRLRATLAEDADRQARTHS